MNMHPHSDQLYALAKLLGIEFTEDGVILAPSLPLESYSFQSPLIGMEKSTAGYRGWYNPSAAGTWRIQLRLPASEAKKVRRIDVNEKEQAVKGSPEGFFKFSGASAPGKSLRWSVQM